MGCKTEERVGQRKVAPGINRLGQNERKNEPFEFNAVGTGITDDYTYNLMEQLELERKSLWRIQNSYKSDASMGNESRQLWSLIEKDKEEIVRLLAEKVRERL